VLVGRLVERRVHDLGRLDGSLPVGDLLRALVNQEHDHVRLRVGPQDALGDLLQDGRLSGLRRGHHHAALSLPNRGDQVDDALRDVLRVALQAEPLVRKQWRQLVELATLPRGVGVHAVDGLDLQQRVVLLVVARRADLAGHLVALAQSEPADLAERDVDVVRAGQVAGGA
jgi:hypothetical protein